MGPQGGDDGDDVLQQHAPGDLNAPPVVRVARSDDFQIEVSPIHASDDVSAPDVSAEFLAGPSQPTGSPFGARSLTRRRPLAAVGAGAVVALLLTVVLSTLPGLVRHSSGRHWASRRPPPPHRWLPARTSSCSSTPSRGAR